MDAGRFPPESLADPCWPPVIERCCLRRVCAMLHRLWFQTVLALMATALAVVLPLEVFAQAPQPKPVVGLKGKIQEISNNLIGIADSTSKPILVELLPGTEIKVEGTATPDFLTPGLYVEFAADMTRQGVLQAPLEEITICDVTDQMPTTFKPDDPTKPLPKEKDAVAKYFVRGLIRTNKNGKLMISSPGGSVRGELSPTAKVKVAVQHLDWVQPKDDILIEAGVEGEDAAHVKAYRVKITMLNPLEGAKKKLPVKKKAK